MNIAVIFAGGVGSRMQSKDRPKQFLELNNKPIIIHTLEHFESHPLIDAIVVVCVEPWIDYLKTLLYKYRIDKVVNIVPGGTCGQLSIYNGLVAAKEFANSEKSIVLIHDGVRPLINAALISKNIDCVKEHGSCITTAVIKETIVEITENNTIKTISDRKQSRAARAPQSFYLDEIFEAHKKAISLDLLDFIDSCSMMKYFGKELFVVEGPNDNIKITTPDDFYTMRSILQLKEDKQLYEIE